MIEWPVPGTNPVAWTPKVATSRDVSEHFEPVRAAIRGEPEDEWTRPMLEALDDQKYADRYVQCAPLVARLVGSELDTETAGMRGLGRMTTLVPRLGGQFRRKLRDEGRKQKFGLLMEETIIAGYATAVAMYQLAKNGPPALSERTQGQVWELWIPRAIHGLHGQNARFSLPAEVSERFYAEGKAELVGPLALRKRLKLSNNINFLVAAGATLFEVNSSLVDSLRTLGPQEQYGG